MKQNIQHSSILHDADIERNMKGNIDEYNKGFFAATGVYGNTHFYLLYIYNGAGRKH